MTGFTMEIKKIDERRSLVLWVRENGSYEFVVCSYYDATQPIGSQWSWGHYFNDIYEAVDYAREEM